MYTLKICPTRRRNSRFWSFAES